MNGTAHAGLAVLAAVFVAAVFAVRWALTPVREPAPYTDGAVTVVTPIAQFMREQEWEPVYGIALEQARGRHRAEAAS